MARTRPSTVTTKKSALTGRVTKATTKPSTVAKKNTVAKTKTIKKTPASPKKVVKKTPAKAAKTQKSPAKVVKKVPAKTTKVATPKKTSKGPAKTVKSPSKTVKKTVSKVTKKSPTKGKKTVKKSAAKKKSTPKKKSTGRRVQFADAANEEEDDTEEEEDSDAEDGGGVCPEIGGRNKYRPPARKPKAGSIEEKIDLIAKEIDRPHDMLIRVIGVNGVEALKKESLAKIKRMAQIAHKMETGEIRQQIIATFGICMGTIPLCYLRFTTTHNILETLTATSSQAAFVDPYESFKAGGQFGYFLYVDRVRRLMSDDPAIQNGVHRIHGIGFGVM